MGPTAVGKTLLSLELAEKLNAEIVCVDSLVVYRDFNIGTAKPTLEERQRVPHHVIDLISPEENFTAFDFCEAANQAIRLIQKKGKKVFLVGGSGLYLKALTRGMFQAPPSDPLLKKELEKEMEEEGSERMYQKLRAVDPEWALTLHPHDRYRILRALEVFKVSGKKFSEFRQKHNPKQASPFLKIGLTIEREKLYQNIEHRTQKMLADGLIEEVSGLMKKYPLTCKPFKSVGYKETLQFLQSSSPGLSGGSKELSQKITQATRHLAKGQWTWFRKDLEIQWFSPHDSQIYRKIAELF